MSSTSNIALQQTPEGLLITVAGTISERAELAVPEFAPGQRIILDASGVSHINSLGVRTWIRFVNALCRQSHEIVIRQLSPVLVLQASMISTFLGCARVETFVTPWVCSACDSETNRVLGISDPVPDALPCTSCGGVMELDSDTDAYLAFRSA